VAFAGMQQGEQIMIITYNGLHGWIAARRSRRSMVRLVNAASCLVAILRSGRFSKSTEGDASRGGQEIVQAGGSEE
jgi:hypothetical protein